MSLKIHFASLSMGASVDQQTGNLSVFDLVEEIRTPQLPIHLQSLVISLSIEKKQPQEFQGQVLIHALMPDGKQQMVGNGQIQIPPEQRRLKAVFRFGGFPITAFGAHRFVLSWVGANNSKIAETILDFDVIQVTQVAQGAAPDHGSTPPMSH